MGLCCTYSEKNPRIRRCRKHVTFKNTPLPWFLVFHIVFTQKLSEEKAAKSSKQKNLHLQQLAACSYLLLCSFRTKKKKIQQTKNVTFFPYGHSPHKSIKRFCQPDFSFLTLSTSIISFEFKYQCNK